MSMSDTETAERLTNRRARMAPAFAILFVTQQGIFLVDRPHDGSRLVEYAQSAAWLLLSAALLLLLSTGGYWFRPARVRALMNDETTRGHRDEALRVGFLAAMIGGIALYFFNIFAPIAGREAIHLMMSMGIASALVRFGLLERRALAG